MTQRQTFLTKPFFIAWWFRHHFLGAFLVDWTLMSIFLLAWIVPDSLWPALV